jgi:hypothetical protein
MTIWIEKTVTNEDVPLLQDTFDKQWEAFGSPRGMFLVSVNDIASGTSRLIAGFPDDVLVGPYKGFTSTDDDQLPEKATLLVGHDASSVSDFQSRSDNAKSAPTGAEALRLL